MDLLMLIVKSEFNKFWDGEKHRKAMFVKKASKNPKESQKFLKSINCFFQQ